MPIASFSPARRPATSRESWLDTPFCEVLTCQAETTPTISGMALIAMTGPATRTNIFVFTASHHRTSRRVSCNTVAYYYCRIVSIVAQRLAKTMTRPLKLKNRRTTRVERGSRESYPEQARKALAERFGAWWRGVVF